MALGGTESPATTQSEYGMLVMLGLVLMYIALSSSLISFNKYLMSDDRFPFPCYLVLLHTVVSSLCTSVLYKARPSAFPTLSDPERRAAIDRKLILTKFLPVAAFFTVQLVMSNMAYEHLSVAFLQMMKECNLVFVFGLSLVVALETFNWRKAGIIVFVLLATSLTIHGELHFNATGFTIQLSSQAGECLKIVLQAVLLTSAGFRIDPLSYVILVMPLCFALLTSALCLGALVGGPLAFPVPSLAHVEAWAPLLFLNACIAFALNVVIAAVIQKVSSVGFLLAGIAKDALIVLCGCIFLGEEISRSQGVGFAMQLQGTLAWTVLKLYPEEFEPGFMQGLMTVSKLMVCCEEKVQKEKQGPPASAGPAPGGPAGAPQPDEEAPSARLLESSGPRSYGSAAER